MHGKMDAKPSVTKSGGKKLDDDSDEDDQPKAVQNNEQPAMKSDLLDLGGEPESKPAATFDLLNSLGSGDQS